MTNAATFGETGIEIRKEQHVEGAGHRIRTLRRDAGKSAQLTAEELDGRTIAGATVISRIVPNTFFESIAAAQQAIADSL